MPLSGEWFATQRPNNNKRNGSDAFESDWSSYESRGNNRNTISSYRQQHQPQQQVPQSQSYQNNMNANSVSSYNASNNRSSNNNNVTASNNNNNNNNSPMNNNINPYKNNKSSSSTTIQSPYAKKPNISNNNNRINSYFSPPPPPPPPYGNNRVDNNNSQIDPSIFKSSMKNPKPTVSMSLEDGCETLNEEQRLVIESVLSGYSTFFTGPAGSGKSHALSSTLRLNEEVRKNASILFQTKII